MMHRFRRYGRHRAAAETARRLHTHKTVLMMLVEKLISRTRSEVEVRAE